MCQKPKQHALKGQKFIAQGNALGIWYSINNAPCKGNYLWLNRVALTGRQTQQTFSPRALPWAMEEIGLSARFIWVLTPS